MPEGKKSVLAYAAAAGLLVIAGIVGYFSFAPSRLIFFGTYTLDPFASFFKVFAAGAGILVILMSVDYLKPRKNQGEYYVLLLLSTLAIMLLAGSSDLIMVYLSLEFISLASYVLAGYLKEDVKSNEAALKYFLFGAITSAAMLYGMSLLFGLTGTTNLYEITTKITASAASPALYLSLLFLLAGFGFKLAMVPFHMWAPDVYEGAPTPITAYFSVGPKAAGFAVLLRFLLVPLFAIKVDWVILIAFLSAVTMTIGNLIAIPQKNIKRMLAYSSIAQAGYILIGLAASGSGFGIPGMLIYLTIYLFMNLGAFAVAVAFENQTGSSQIEDYAGLAQINPLLALALVVFFLSLVGIPPTGGFIGKFFIFGAAIDRGLLWLAIVGVVNSVISLYYYFNVVRQMYFLPVKENRTIALSPTLGLVLATTLILTLAIGIYPELWVNLGNASARILLP